MVEVFWLLLDATKGSNTILPIHHPFWDQHRPGDRWLRPDVTDGNNCHCSLEATDEHPTAPPRGFELRGNGPQPGLNENPAKTGRLFAQSHPYFPQSCAQCAFYQGGIASGFKNQEKDCEHCKWINKFIPLPLSKEEIRKRQKEIQSQAEQICQSVLRHENISFSPIITKARVKEWLNQPHMHQAEKNELILDIKNVFEKSTYRGYGPDKHDPRIKMHLFEIEIMGDKSWMIVREFPNGEYVLHSISDRPSILNYLTNAK